MQHRPELDGLRAFAVLPVILHHAGIPGFTGGFLGVDIFFVISGFLITSILIEDLEQRKLSILGFYERRARRILPALFLMMLVSVPFAYFWMTPYKFRDFAQSLLAATTFSSNILFWREDGYFAASAELKPMLHTWSLAVEEQFYLLFPLALTLVWRFGRRAVVGSMVAIALVSLVSAEWGWRHAPSANFYLGPTRVWELLAGSLLAMFPRSRPSRLNGAFTAAGLMMIATAMALYDPRTPTPSVYTLVPVMGAVMVIHFAHAGQLATRVLVFPVFVAIGLISYSAYLWHQPIFAFARLRTLTEPSLGLMAFLCVVSLLVAWASWAWVERPFRRAANPVLSRRSSVFFAAFMVGAGFVAFGLLGHFSGGLAAFRSDNAEIAGLDRRVATNFGLSLDCESRFSDSPNCRTSTEPEVLVWGDSYAMHIVPGLLAAEPDARLQQHTLSGCTPIIGYAQVGGEKTIDWAYRCIEFNAQVFDWLRRNDSVSVVILSSPFTIVPEGTIVDARGRVVTDDALEFLATQLLDTVQTIRDMGRRVVIVSPTPASGWDTGQCLLRATFFGEDHGACSFPLDVSTFGYDLLNRIADDVPVYWLHRDFCDGALCIPYANGVFLYRDSGHLSIEGSAFLGRNFDWMARLRALAQ